MIEDQLSAMPARKAGEDGREDRQGEAVRQHFLGEIEAHAPIGGRDGEKRHGCDGMGPTADTHPDAFDEQQFRRTCDRGEHAEPEGKAGRPYASAQEERVAREPVEDVYSEGRHDESDGEVDEHGVNGVSRDRDNRAYRVLGHLLHHGARFVAGVVAVVVFGHFSSHRRLSVATATLRRGRWFLLPAAGAALAGCSGPLSALDPAGPAAATMATLWWVMLAGSVVLALLVFVLLALVYRRPGTWRNVEPAHWIVGGGLVMPVVVLTALVGYALYAGEQLLAHPNPDVPRVVANGEMWVWRFSYPDYPQAEETEELHIPAGQPVDVIVTSSDVIHGFWVPRLGGKIDAIPGHQNVIRLQADRPGTYNGVCAEFCGNGHAAMRFVVIAHDPAEYEAALSGGAQ